MRRQSLNTGTRTQILAELESYGRDQASRNAEKAAAYADAVREIGEGSTWVEVGSAVYRVVEGDEVAE
jgi:hypothetical protein